MASYIGNAYISDIDPLSCFSVGCPAACTGHTCSTQHCSADTGCGRNACGSDICSANICPVDSCAAASCIANMCGIEACLVDFGVIPLPCGINACFPVNFWSEDLTDV